MPRISEAAPLYPDPDLPGFMHPGTSTSTLLFPGLALLWLLVPGVCSGSLLCPPPPPSVHSSHISLLRSHPQMYHDPFSICLCVVCLCPSSRMQAHFSPSSLLSRHAPSGPGIACDPRQVLNEHWLSARVCAGIRQLKTVMGTDDTYADGQPWGSGAHSLHVLPAHTDNSPSSAVSQPTLPPSSVSWGSCYKTWLALIPSPHPTVSALWTKGVDPSKMRKQKVLLWENEEGKVGEGEK